MSIVTESYVPKLILQLNSIQKIVNYKGIEREITHTYWTEHIGPLLYPNWDTDKDKLIQLNYYDTGAFHAKRRKFVKNFTTNEYEWKDYEMESPDIEEGKVIFEKLKEAFYLMDSIEKESFQKDLADAYYEARNISWFGIRLVRNFLLEDSDWTMLPDTPVSEEDKPLWIKYRQALRNIPQVEEFNEPIDVRFPMSPFDWMIFYKDNSPDKSEYLESTDHYIKLSGYYINNFRERIVKYLMLRQSVANPLNYKAYRDYLTAPNKNSPWSEDQSEEAVDNLLMQIAEMEENNS